MAGSGTSRTVLLIVSGSIAAFKAPELVRLLGADGIQVRCVLTQGGSQFVTPLTLQALSGNPVHTDLFSLTAEQEMGHIALSRSADLLLVCPASANLLARMAGGLADDLASTLLLATDTPVMVAPGMNVRMWEHAATQANIRTLKERGVQVLGPVSGPMACGEFGPGRMVEPTDVRDSVLAFFRQQARQAGRLAGKSFLVTAGPTHEPLDPVRYLANRSSGRQGYALAESLADLGADVTLVSGPTGLRAPAGVTVSFCETARQMRDLALNAVQAHRFDAAICTAAVADWRPAVMQDQKIKKTGRDDQPAPLALIPNPDILAELSELSPFRPSLVVGFAAETEKVEAHARAKLERKGCNWIVANDVGAGSDVMGGPDNQVILMTQDTVEHWPRLSKEEVARRLAMTLADWFSKAN
ncbi:bifunctional phosphopantothenoylcysteine decarboxylase/phosphopantothenate--cysteine ligase CoaBC [Acetobacter farinalis]|uniref:Coenzyme A biosynthesis bifunctional protein CoaBC n=1 Tax=Acetobacter farinalis TaxID=1260984 RepID=A0ABT3Q573_9PROT|nr:bifunctional phosphopantothenoylcysteine decarboxylase/phosphopantothenate--cysteine ligase CoaBC [Acetobacter farinalis]MCX2560427.1 bifunctional phosphopantothenoylcysteine decarboxylase/phosphopantothenate--cysteine ligase CoaBC [Acetobacter farinalis]NHO29082.1 bifunctional phosphopantothenoylcysteine decarboxylase/phosphopantothenate--cysteine ligase CoaBC [Acetobacter farinalis]